LIGTKKLPKYGYFSGQDFTFCKQNHNTFDEISLSIIFVAKAKNSRTEG